MTRITAGVVVVIYLVSLSFISNAQVKDSIKTENTYIPFETIVKQLESKYSIKFFYNAEWFKGRSFESQITKLPLQEALTLLKEQSQLSLKKLNELYYVFVPETGGSDESGSDSKFYIVGDFLSFGSKSKVTVTGIIRDGKNNQPLPASIVFTDLNKTVGSDFSGKFSVVLPVGEHIMKVSYPGYDDNIKNLRVLSEGEITINMLEKTIMLNEVLITTDKIDQNFRRTQMSVMKFDTKSIKELPTTLGEADVVKSLSLLPGVQTTGEFGSGFNVRGGSSDQNLVLIEDVPIFNTSHLFGLTSIINADGVVDMTLYKGGIPVIYGERASSVLNLRLGSENLTKVRVKGGISLINSRLNLEVPVGNKVTVMVGGRTSYSDWMLKQMPDADLMNSSAGFYDMNGLITYTINQNNKLSLFAYTSNDKFGFAGSQSYDYGNKLASLRFTHKFNGKIFTSLVVGTSLYNSGFLENDTLKPLESYKINNSIGYRNLKWNLLWEVNEQHVITFGVNAFLYNIKPGEVTPFGSTSLVAQKTVQEEQGLETAAFISDDFKMSDRFSAEVGIRYSSFYNLGPKKVLLYDPQLPKSIETITDSAIYKKSSLIKKYSGVEPRVSLRFNFDKNTSIRISYNRMNQYINLVSNTSVITPTDLWKLSDTYISPVVSDQFAFGFFKNTKNNTYETSVEVYYKPYKNVIEYKNGAQILLNDHIETDLIKAKGQSFGTELYLKKNTGKFTGWISYTFSRSLRKTSAGFQEEKINGNTYFPDNLDRPHNLVINGGYYINRRWRFAFTFNYNTGRPVTLPELKYTIKGYQIAYYSDRNKYRMPDYHRLDISLSRYENLKIKKSWKGYWTFSVINVYARHNAYSVFYQKDQSPFNLNEGRYNLYKLYIIGRPLPVFTYNFIF